MTERAEQSSRAGVVAIHLANASGAPMMSVDEVQAVAGRGLRGDRYFAGGDIDGSELGPGQQVTLIESEAIERAAQEAEMDFRSSDSRRNIVTRGVELNDLVGREFRVGGVRLRGVELCEPCTHIVQLSGRKVLRSLVHHGGLRAEIIDDGLIRVGDAVQTP